MRGGEADTQREWRGVREECEGVWLGGTRAVTRRHEGSACKPEERNG